MQMPAPGTNFGQYFCKSYENNFWSICESRFMWDIHGFKEEPVIIELIADPEGNYMGWLDSEGRHGGKPYFIQHKKVFNIQFPYGYKAEEEAGRGIAVRLRVQEVSP